MIFFDMTKTGPARHRSGLTRVSARLCDELGDAATPVAWSDWNRLATREDWFVTAELFSEAERPGFSEFVRNPPCRLAAIYHDAIPLKLPHITWPQSVARQPSYIKLLAGFDRVLAVSEASWRELEEFWRWQKVEVCVRTGVLPLGADFDGSPRITDRSQTSTFSPQLLCLGIIEPRKNQSFLLDVCAELWREGVDFELHLVGRVNPHFGQPIVAKIKALKKEFAGLHFHEAADDKTVAALYVKARASVCPTLAEGCGLPLLESLWRGVPCVCSDLPVLRENADGGGCVVATVNDSEAWKTALQKILTDDEFARGLRAAAMARPLASWTDSAAALRAALEV